MCSQEEIKEMGEGQKTKAVLASLALYREEVTLLHELSTNVLISNTDLTTLWRHPASRLHRQSSSLPSFVLIQVHQTTTVVTVFTVGLFMGKCALHHSFSLLSE